MSDSLKDLARAITLPGTIKKGYQPDAKDFDISKISPPEAPTAAFKPEPADKSHPNGTDETGNVVGQ
ncbi:MAG: hypothetical protein QOF01_932 [Thermomicrobiales bacterium]|jgi:hypothetical protein|nr:hypothetical protein [Thermomicrobiales bacterium]